MYQNINKKLSKAGMHVEPEAMAFDVVCSMEVDPEYTKLHVEHQGTVYYFCSTTCKNHFVMDPEKYIG